ncbi:MAG: hypothetical protein GY757_57045, partial [bacterium]|nr:hypothetical protein [bacterium]
SFALNKNETAKLKKMAKENEITLYMTILSIYTLLLSKLSGQEDIIVGTPTAGRRHADLENIIGMFVNTLAIRNTPKSGKTIEEYLREVKENTMQAFENQEYQFEELVDRLSVKRNTGRNPIFDVMFNLRNQTETKKRGTTTSPQNSNTPNTLVTTSKFDLSLRATETGDSVNVNFEYSTKLFKEETIKRYITYFKGIIQTITKETHRKISEIEIITEEEKNRILYEFNETAVDNPREKTIHQLFGEQVERTPDSIALVGREKPVGSRQYAVGKEKTKDNKTIKNKKETIQGKESAIREKTSSIQHPVSSIQQPASSTPSIPSFPSTKSTKTTQLTYRELNKKSNQLAAHIIQRG